MGLLGAHVSVAGGLARAFDRGEALECEAIQIFTRNQLQWETGAVSLAEAELFYRRWRQSSIRDVVSHASYLINLAAPGLGRAKSLRALEQEIHRCDALGIDKMVLHPGSFREGSEEEGLALLAEGLEQVLGVTEDTRVCLLLETMAGTGHTLGGRLEHFSQILDAVDDHPRVGICLDTCHLLAAGYDLRSEAAYEQLMRAVEDAVGRSRVRCWHLNDSREARGTKRDRHAHVGEGAVGLAPFGWIVQDDRWDRVPCILETPKDGPGDAGNLALLRKLRGR